eukprot:Seg18313.1 transcript_id=Seg18313.1/GoldUCD/mRNA.D3Y31 product="hypothetical protein" protein_id=Seg18313.1/GoldUCD/D3Y31
MFSIGTGAKGAPEIQNIRLSGDYYWSNQLSTIVNKGGEKEVYIGYDNTTDEHRLRTLIAPTPVTATGQVPVQLTITQNGDHLEWKAHVDKSDLPDGGTSGLSGTLAFKPNDGTNVGLTQTFLGGAWQGTTATISFQTPIQAGDHLALKNFADPVANPSTLMLANAGFKPKKGTVGFRKCNGCVNGQAAKAWFYGTDWIDADADDPDPSAQDTPTQGGTTNGS